MAYAAATATLSDRRRFPSFFRTYPSDGNFVPVVVDLILSYGWRQVLVFTEDVNLFLEVIL